MVHAKILCPKCRKPLSIADDEYDEINRSYVLKVICDHCGYGGMMQVVEEYVEKCTETPTKN